jgi:NAD(P)H-nitrite reductase large subunit
MSPKPRHHVIIGSGVAGAQAARTLRSREPQARISILTLSALPFYNRFDLPQVFRGKHDWRDFLADTPAYYRDNRIGLRRCTQVSNVDATNQRITLAHNEEIAYDTLLVASGCRAYLPEELTEFKALLDPFGSFEQAMNIRRKLPDRGTAMILGGDMIGLDLARTLIDTGHKVVLVADKYTFWPHKVSDVERRELLGVLEKKGIEIIAADAEGGIATIQQGAKGMPARQVTFGGGRDRYADVILPFYGLMPAVEFMLGAGVDIERGLLVSPTLRTTNNAIFAAGDVCQIWSESEKRYRFFYGWKNVRAMGDLAARNVTGDDDTFEPTQDETLHIHDGSTIHSPFWEYA